MKMQTPSHGEILLRISFKAFDMPHFVTLYPCHMGHMEITWTHWTFLKMVIHRCFRRIYPVDVTKMQLVLIYPVVINVCAMMDGSAMEFHARLYNVQKVFMAKQKNVILFNRHGQLIFDGYYVYIIYLKCSIWFELIDFWSWKKNCECKNPTCTDVKAKTGFKIVIAPMNIMDIWTGQYASKS